VVSPYQVFSDGSQPGAAAKGQRRIGPGGWGVLVLLPDGTRSERCGYDPATTVPRMEMTAALKGLELVPPGAAATVTSDSQLLVKGASEWMAGWIRKGWRTSQGTPVENRDLWERLLEAQRDRAVAWAWVRGHAGHALNEAADRLAALGAAGKDPAGRALVWLPGGRSLRAVLTPVRPAGPGDPAGPGGGTGGPPLRRAASPEETP
jgi:ribonuclease HI